MKKLIKYSGTAFLLASVATGFYVLITEGGNTLISILSYAGYFFVACVCLIACTWFGLGSYKFVKIYYDYWREEEGNSKWLFVAGLTLIILSFISLAVYLMYGNPLINT